MFRITKCVTGGLDQVYGCCSIVLLFPVTELFQRSLVFVMSVDMRRCNRRYYFSGRPEMFALNQVKFQASHFVNFSWWRAFDVISVSALPIKAVGAKSFDFIMRATVFCKQINAFFSGDYLYYLADISPTYGFLREIFLTVSHAIYQ